MECGNSNLIKLRLRKVENEVIFIIMSTIIEIETAIEQLPPEDFEKLANWIDQRRNAEWDRQMESDSATGRLDFLFEEAALERKAETLKDWPPAK